MWELDSVAEGFQWIDANDSAGNTFSFLRFGSPGSDGLRPAVASIVNFSGGPHYSFRLGLPHPGRWNEILNTDAEKYGGSGVGNLGSVMAEEVPWHGQPYSAVLTLPPLGAVWLEPAAQAEHVGPAARADAADAAESAESAGATDSTQTAESSEPGLPLPTHPAGPTGGMR
jgi:1,4-alpha-glucan branching enzyme